MTAWDTTARDDNHFADQFKRDAVDPVLTTGRPVADVTGRHRRRARVPATTPHDTPAASQVSVIVNPFGVPGGHAAIGRHCGDSFAQKATVRSTGSSSNSTVRRGRGEHPVRIRPTQPRHRPTQRDVTDRPAATVVSGASDRAAVGQRGNPHSR